MDQSAIWDMTVSLSIPSEIDEREVREALGILLDPKGAHEIRGLSKPSGDRRQVRSRLVKASQLDAAIKAIGPLGDCEGVYYTLNPVRPTLGDYAAKKDDVLTRRLFLVDCDRTKVKGDPTADQMATEEEKAHAFDLANRVGDWLIAEGWPVPIMIDSGNGAHLLYRIDLPNTELSRVLLSRALKALAERFKDNGAAIDVRNIDAPRIAKLPGTWVRKGASTVERPWRIAKLLYAPDDGRIVSLEQIEALTHQGKPHADEPVVTPDPWVMVKEAPPDKTSAYVASGIDRELAKVVLSNPGQRNNALNEAAFAIGQFVGGGFIGRTEAEKKLRDAASRTGLSDFEIDRTIASGLDAGQQQPRVLPATVMGASKNGPATKPTPIPPSGKRIVWASDIQTKKVTWLWPHRIPLGKMTTFAGQTGMGKTFTMCDLAARITSGNEIPFCGGQCFEPGKVLFISAEDDADDTIVPRFLELGGDSRRLAVLSPEAEENFSLAALELLNASLDDMGPDVLLICIDPPTSYIGKVDDHKNAQLRGLLGPLKRFCTKRHVAMVFGTHVNKAIQGNVEAMARVIGGVAWVTGVRSAHMFCVDPDDKDASLFVPLKVNNGPKPKGLAYQIENTPSEAGKLIWKGEDDRSADEAMGKVKKKSRGVCAVEWLTERFRENSQWESEELVRSAREAGISGRTAFVGSRSQRTPPKTPKTRKRYG